MTCGGVPAVRTSLLAAGPHSGTSQLATSADTCQLPYADSNILPGVVAVTIDKKAMNYGAHVPLLRGAVVGPVVTSAVTSRPTTAPVSPGFQVVTRLPASKSKRFTARFQVV